MWHKLETKWDKLAGMVLSEATFALVNTNIGYVNDATRTRSKNNLG